MSYFYKNFNNFTIKLIYSEIQEDNRCIHYMEVRIGNFRWLLPKVFAEFEEFHTQMLEYGVDPESFPPKRQEHLSHAVAGASKKRLHNYMQKILQKFHGLLPEPLKTFIELQKYDCYFIVEDLWIRYRGDHEEEVPDRMFEMSVVEVHALTRVFRETFPDLELTEALDYASIVDALNSMQHISITGSNEMYLRTLKKINDMEMDFCFYKSLLILDMTMCGFEKITSLGTIRSTLSTLNVQDSNMQTLAHFLLNDAIDRRITIATQMWPNMRRLILNNCQIQEIDISIRLVPNLHELNLADNNIKVLPDLRFLTQLHIIDLSGNEIDDWDDMHHRLRNITVLAAAGNQINSLRGFRHMEKLEYLNLSENNISDFEEIKECIVPLPRLKLFNFEDNPVTTIEKYTENLHALLTSEATSERTFYDMLNRLSLSLKEPTPPGSPPEPAPTSPKPGARRVSTSPPLPGDRPRRKSSGSPTPGLKDTPRSKDTSKPSTSAGQKDTPRSSTTPAPGEKKHRKSSATVYPWVPPRRRKSSGSPELGEASGSPTAQLAPLPSAINPLDELEALAAARKNPPPPPSDSDDED